MEERTITIEKIKTVYIASDGKEFDTKQACCEHESIGIIRKAWDIFDVKVIHYDCERFVCFTYKSGNDKLFNAMLTALSVIVPTGCFNLKENLESWLRVDFSNVHASSVAEYLEDIKKHEYKDGETYYLNVYWKCEREPYDDYLVEVLPIDYFKEKLQERIEDFEETFGVKFTNPSTK